MGQGGRGSLNGDIYVSVRKENVLNNKIKYLGTIKKNLSKYYVQKLGNNVKNKIALLQGIQDVGKISGSCIHVLKGSNLNYK